MHTEADNKNQEREKELDKDHSSAFGWEDGDDLGIRDSIKSTVQEFKSLDYKYLLPLSRVLNGELLKKRAVQYVLLFGLLPLVFFLIHRWFNLKFEQTVWLIEGYFCLFWALYFYSIIRPDRKVWRRAVGYALFTAFVGIPLLLLAQQFPIVRNLYAGTDSYSFLSRLFGYVFGVGVLEEVFKALPLLIFGLRNNKIRSVREGIFLGMMSGFGFAAAEGVQYTIRATLRAHDVDTFASVTDQFLQFMFRIMTGPVLHGAWAGVVGWFIAVAAFQNTKKWPIIVVGIAYMALLHGLYDVFAGRLIGIILACFTFLLFMNYLVHGDEEKEAYFKKNVIDESN